MLFQEGDLVLLKLQPYRQILLHHKSVQKLFSCFYGPFNVVPRIGEVAYKLDLPLSSKLHLVFHLSSLKAFHGQQGVPSTLTFVHHGIPHPSLQSQLAP